MPVKFSFVLAGFVVLTNLSGGIDLCAQDTTLRSFDLKDSLSKYEFIKLKEEAEQLKRENAIEPFWRYLPEYAGILTALIAVIGAYISYQKYLIERRKETEQRAYETMVRLQEKFDAIAKDLGAKSNLIKASAATSILSFLRPEHKEFHEQAYLVLLSSLKTKLPSHVNALLVRAFEKAIRLVLSKDTVPDFIGNTLDLTRANLYRVDLSGLDLSNADIAFSDLSNANLENCVLVRVQGISANLSGARLSRSNLREARMHKANFEGAYFHAAELVSAKFRNANAKNAEFQQAQMQETNLDGADVTGAKFENADLNNGYFRAVTYNTETLKSILNAKKESWLKANFDPSVTEQLKKLAQNKQRGL